VVEGDLYRRGANGILMQCITQEEGCDLLAEIHEGECGSHSSSRTLVGKAFRYGFYWPTALQDAAELVKSCKACQFHAKQIHTLAQALQMIPPSWPFAVGGLDILGPFSRAIGEYRYIYIAIDRFIKWPEATPVVNITKASATAFLKSNCVSVWGPKPDYHRQWDPVQEPALPRVLRGYRHPALFHFYGTSQK
jgi:hypothetical protein